MSRKELADATGMSKWGEKSIKGWEEGSLSPSEKELNTILSFPEIIPFPNNEKATYKMIDLFAGIGGTRLGFYKTGKVNVVFSSEIDKFSIKTYKANFGETPSGDITKIGSEDIPDHDILVGGFPCQSFSQAGKKLGFKDTRGTLFFEIERVLRDKRPKAFLLENVKNLKSHKGGETYEVIERALRNLNYEVYSTILRARDFGVPQNRERIYIVGFDKDAVQGYRNFKFPEATHKNTCLGDILESEVDDKYTISNTLWEGHKRRKVENKKKGKGFGYSLFNFESPYANTLSARYYKDGSEVLIEQKGKNPRKLTPREAARLQGFPDEFIIPVSDTQSYKQFGNSVAVPVIYAIARNIISALES
ncbi:C-5 cytosine-specific DNA methylase [Mycoplasma haemofelis str. Langford 1]|uniref:Cytosine-specific methyltransferase n=1 Tax=Mycoplasma haemofelis (strain Langford 1) TaxID=941640 RepID=E8ZJC4_MYCHL|nr:C-5 cytosine-specific DNA methylase [Mycoplasma haemofelis str. Langford 1]